MPNPFDRDGSDTEQFQDKTPEEFVEELVGDGKKYATPADAIRALAHAQHHIGSLERDNEALRVASQKASTVDDIVEQLAKRSSNHTDGDDQSQESQDEQPDVEALVKSALQQQRASETAQQNKDRVLQTLKGKFAGKAGDVWDEAERSLGVDLDALAQTSPEAALRLLGAASDEQASTTTSYVSDVTPQNTSDPRPPEGSKRLVDYMQAKGEITRQQAYRLKLKYSADEAKYRA